MSALATSFPETISVETLITASEYLLRLSVVFFLWWIASLITKRFIKRLAASWRAGGHGKRADTLAGVLVSLSKYALGFIGVCAILNVFHVPIASVLAVAGVGGLAIGFGAQSLVKDFITGFFILFEGQFGVGDIVSIAGKTGTVEALGLRTTYLRSFDGDAHIIPNSQIMLVTNMNGSLRHAVVDITFDEQTFQALCGEMRRANEKLPMLVSEPAVIVMGEPEDRHIRIIAECRVGEKAACEKELYYMTNRMIKERKD
ncbi:MAG: mechanosensitive ion channel family protein [Defluviitaleaceae bacterium]|nr:mechanosensitive ion channel family protein [Defluviitaleaceae bacterium]